MEKIFDPTIQDLVHYALKVIGAVIILIIGRIVAGITKKLIVRLLSKTKADAAIISFTGTLSYFLVLTFAILAALAKCGVETTSFIAVLGAAGLAVGLALQGSLSNFASGLLILILRPFKIGDFIEAAGVAGTVKQIELFTTVLATIDNVKIMVPNAKLFGDVIKNFSGYDLRRIDLEVGIDYGSPIATAIQILDTLVKEDARIVTDPMPQIAVSSLADSSVKIVFRPWVKKEDYWDVRFDLTRKVKESFEQNNIEIPFPQHVVHNK